MFYLSPHDVERFRRDFLPLRYHASAAHVADYICGMVDDPETCPRIHFTERYIRDYDLTTAIFAYLATELPPADLERARRNFRRNRVEVMASLNRGNVVKEK